jgi:IS5 family transposase
MSVLQQDPEIARTLGHKLQASAEEYGKLIRKIAVTYAAVADIIVFETLLDASNITRDIYVDRGYLSIEREINLEQTGWRITSSTEGMLPGASETEKRPNRCIASARQVSNTFSAP